MRKERGFSVKFAETLFVCYVILTEPAHGTLYDMKQASFFSKAVYEIICLFSCGFYKMFVVL